MKIKVGQIWKQQKWGKETAVIVKIENGLVWWFADGFMNKDCLNACENGFFTDNHYVLIKD